MICGRRLELGLQRLAEADRLAGDDVHQRPALDAGEDGPVERPWPSLPCTARAPARGPRSVLCVVEVTKSATGTGIVVQAGGHQAGDVGHVDHQHGADLAGDLGELACVDLARVGAGAGDDQLRLVLAGQPGDLVEVDAVVSSRRRRS